MTTWRTIGLVIQRDVRARTKSFLIISLLAAGVVSAMILVPALLADDGGNSVSLSDEEADRLVAAVGVILVFMAILWSGQVIALAVGEEKRSRVVEVIMGAVRPRDLLLGKVIAIGSMALAEVLIVGVAAVVVGRAAGSVELPRVSPSTIATVTVWFLLGFAFYAVAYAAAGSIVSPHDNPANATFPLNLLLMVGYFVALTSLPAETDTLVLRIMSFFPPTAPLTMPLRMVQGYAADWEVLVSAALMLLSTVLVIRVASRLYIGGVKRGITKTRLREAWRSSAA